MELYRWGKEKIRVRLDENDLTSLHLDRETKTLGEEDKAALQGVVNLAREEYSLPDDLFVEIFPGKSGLILQIGPWVEEILFYLKDTDRMLTLYPLAKKLGARIWRRRDGGGYYLAASSRRAALPFTEFAKATTLREDNLRSRCKRIL